MDSGVDESIISIQNRGFKAVFDTGASENIICVGALRKLKNIKIDPEMLEYKCSNRGIHKKMGTAIMDFVYDKKPFHKTLM